MPHALILGAGRIGRGFLGQLLHRGGYTLTFVDAVAGLAAKLKAAGGYRVDVAGRPEAGERIPVADAIALADPALAAAVARADLLACAVGAPNLEAVAGAIAPHLPARLRAGPLDWLICENADRPAATLARALGGLDGLADRLGLIETQVLRSGMDADPAALATDPLAVKVSDWWTLPCDAEAFRAAVPAIPGLSPRRNFGNELQRKLFTFNGLNGPIAYLGWANGHRHMDRAANDPALQDLLRLVREESAHGLIAEYAFDPVEHAAFQQIAWDKYRNPALADLIERNARDSARKLGARERLVGPALLALKHGRAPRGYASAIAAALAYDGSDDAGTRTVRAAVAAGGPAAALERCAGLSPEHPLVALVARAWQDRSPLSGAPS